MPLGVGGMTMFVLGILENNAICSLQSLRFIEGISDMLVASSASFPTNQASLHDDGTGALLVLIILCNTVS